MRPQRIKQCLSTTAACLCVLVALLVGCGDDACLFCEGGGDGNGDGNGNGSGDVCDGPFSGLAAYQGGAGERIESFAQQSGEEDRLDLAVIPPGMSFTYGTNQTAQAGDVILADQQASDIFIYEFASPQEQRSLDVGVGQASGLVLLHKEIGLNTLDLLYFTVEAEDTLYIYDLTGTAIFPLGFGNPFAITNSQLRLLFGSDFLESPTSLAISADTEKVAVFVLNDNGADSSVRRLSVDLTTWLPDNPQTIATMNQSTHRLVDIAYFSQTDTLFISKKAADDTFRAGWVYEISNASTSTSSVNLDSEPAFIEENQNITGITLALTSKTGTAANLLLSREGIVENQVGQYGTTTGDLETAFTPFIPPDTPLTGLQAIEYDCTNERLLMTDVPPDDLPNRTFLQAFPAQ